MGEYRVNKNGARQHPIGDGLDLEAKFLYVQHLFAPAAKSLDLRAHPLARKIGVDYVQMGDGWMSSVDEKACKNVFETGNVALELFTLSRTRPISRGWFLYGSNAFIFYICVQSAEVLVLPVDEVRAAVLPRLKWLHVVSAMNPDRKRKGEISHLSYNSLVPVGCLMAWCPGVRIFELPESTGHFASQFPDRVASAQDVVAQLQSLPLYSTPDRTRFTTLEEVTAFMAQNRFAKRDAAEISRCRLAFAEPLLKAA